MRISDIELYHYPATRSSRVKWLLHELVGDEFRVNRLDLYGLDAYSPDYLRLNPNHNVPLIRFRMGGEVVTALESGAILTLLADAFPERQLAPKPARLSAERADYLQMLYFGAAAIDMMLWRIRIHEHVLSDMQRDLRTIERYRKKFMTEVEPQLAARLDRGGFICGPAFSAADCNDRPWRDVGQSVRLVRRRGVRSVRRPARRARVLCQGVRRS